jgi:hypothetical protein
VHKTDHPETFTRRYAALLKHYGLQGLRIQTGQPNENGDIEQRHYRFKRAVEQALLLRGSSDFADRDAYGSFLKKLFAQLNAGRQDRLAEEVKVLKRLPLRRLEACKRIGVKVGAGSTIRVQHNVYSVDSRLIGETVEVRVYAEHLEVWYAQRQMEKIPRLRGSSKHRIQYRHIIDWLVRKPGAFENYRYREDLFPTHRFRMTYDELKRTRPCRASREYVQILYLAARESEAAVDEILQGLLDRGESICSDLVAQELEAGQSPPRVTDVVIVGVDLAGYDALLLGGGEVGV